MMQTSRWLRAIHPAQFVLTGLAALAACSPAPPGTYATPEEAVAALGDFVGSGDLKKVEVMFGKEGVELFQSGDDIADHEDALRVKAMIGEKVAFEDLDEKTKAAVLGKDAWWFPLPLVKENGRWHFDVAGGREELLNRRVGRNELLALASLHAYVDAQREYFAGGFSGKPTAYARYIRSSEGKHDGLYWPVAKGEKESPLGPLFANAARTRQDAPSPHPFNGYYFRILMAQGKNVSGGAYSYLDKKDRLTRGFAAVAWPSKYGNSGVMTFQVNRLGIVFQKDLGAETETAAAAIDTYDPDDSWDPTGD